MIKEWLDSYKPNNEDEIIDALREIMQEVALAGLSRTDFFEKAAFYGGTALRIFYGLDRYSEDMDFSLVTADAQFSLEPYFKAIIMEFEALGMHVSLREIEKAKQSNIESAFLKSDTIWKELVLEDILKQTGVKSNKTIKIKIEVDRIPPQGFETEQKLLLRPFSFYVRCFDGPSLFAGKLHALLFRKWKNRVKGRDWYDLEWYIKQGVSLNVQHFLRRAQDSGDWSEKAINESQVIDLLKDKVEGVSFSVIREDVIRFIPDDRGIQIWSPEYFKDLISKMKFELS